MRYFVIMALSFCLVACADSGEPPLVAEDILALNPEANQVGFGVVHYMANEGIRRARVTADTAFYIDNKTLIDIRVMEVIFFDAQGDTASILTAREGTYNWNTGNMTARTDVVVVNPRENRTVETSVLNFDSTSDRIWGDEPTTITEADGTVIEGTAFETNSRMDRVDLTSAHIVRPGTRQSQREQ